MTKPHLVVLTGSGVSAPSGIPTFRDPDGIWARYNIEEVATPQAWAANPDKVNEFYNERRTQLATVEPNAGHYALAELEQAYRVSVVTQNIDDLHERAGSTEVIHLHGELVKARSDIDRDYVIEIGYDDIASTDRCPKGGQIRPHIVWFGEDVPLIGTAFQLVTAADIIVVAGTSLQVYPAAGLVEYASVAKARYIVDPDTTIAPPGYTLYCGSADEQLPLLAEELLS